MVNEKKKEQPLLSFQDKDGQWKPEYIQHPYLKNNFSKQMTSLLPNLATKFRYFGNPEVLILKVAPSEAWKSTDAGSLIYLRHRSGVH